jgi:alkylhydroperoxidase family enzyme
MTSVLESRQLLVARILEGDGTASHQLRRAAFANTDLSEPLRALINTVAAHPHAVTDEQVSTALASGCSQDQLFELVVCAAVGQSTRQHDAALRSLADAVSEL